MRQADGQIDKEIERLKQANTACEPQEWNRKEK